MKLSHLDKFADWCLNNLKIFEHAQRRSYCISKIYDLSDTLNLHLIKLYLFQNSIHREHWSDEILEYLSKINSLTWSDKKKKFESDDYFEWLYLDYFKNGNDLNVEKIKRIIKKLKEQYKDEYLINYNINELNNIIESFYNQVIYFLENRFDYEKVENLLEEKFNLTS